MPARFESLQPDLSRLQSQLLTSGLSQKDNPTFQVIDQLITATRRIQELINKDVSVVSSSVTGLEDQTYLTETDETVVLPNSRRVLAGTNITFNDAVANQRTISATDTGITQLTGDVTAGPGSGSQVATIAALAVTTGKLADSAVTNIKMADNAVTTNKILNDAITTAKILNKAATYGKIQDISSGSRLLGRGATGIGSPEEITLGPTLSMIGTQLNAGGDVVISSDEQGYWEPLLDGDLPEAELITADGDVIMIFIPGITTLDIFDGMVDRVIETATSRVIANTQCIVVADYFAVEGTGILAIEGDGALAVL